MVSYRIAIRGVRSQAEYEMENCKKRVVTRPFRVNVDRERSNEGKEKLNYSSGTR